MITNVEFVVYPYKKKMYNGVGYHTTRVVYHSDIFHFPPKINIFNYEGLGTPIKIERAA